MTTAPPKTTVCDCGHTVTAEGCTTGYGITRDGRKVCFACCAIHDKAEMSKDGRTVLYLTDNEVTNWPGTLRFAIQEKRTRRHNMAGHATHVWFTDHEGKRWHGVCVGNNTQLCHCRRLKA